MDTALLLWQQQLTIPRRLQQSPTVCAAQGCNSVSRSNNNNHNCEAVVSRTDTQDCSLRSVYASSVLSQSFVATTMQLLERTGHHYYNNRNHHSDHNSPLHGVGKRKSEGIRLNGRTRDGELGSSRRVATGTTTAAAHRPRRHGHPRSPPMADPALRLATPVEVPRLAELEPGAAAIGASPSAPPGREH